MGYFEQSF